MTSERPAIAVGDIVTWKGPRNYSFRPISGTVFHVGKLFVTVRAASGQCSRETYIKHSAITAVTPGSQDQTQPQPKPKKTPRP